MLAAVAYPMFGYLFQKEVPGATDPLLVRVILAAAPMTVLLLTYGTVHVRRWILLYVHLLFYILLLHQVYLVQVNSLSPAYAVALIIAWAAVGASHVRLSHLLVFQLVFLALTALVCSRMTNPAFSPKIFVFSLVLLSIVLAALLRARNRFELRLGAVNDQLSLEIEERRLAESEAEEQRNFFQDILNNVSAEIVVFDARMRYRYVSPSAVRDPKMRERMISQDDFFYARQKQRPVELAERRHAAQLKALREEKTVPFEEEFVDGRGLRKHYMRTITPIRDASGKIVRLVGTGVDITERKITERAIQYMAYHDSLTGLPGREKLQEQFRRIVGQAAPAALFFLDLDRFKIINDTLGHPAGDQLLSTVAGRLVRSVRERGTVYRHGGDQFIVLCPLPGRREATDVARDMLRSLRDPVEAEGHRLFVTAGVGIARFPEDGERMADLIRHADLAMRRAKRAGQNTFHFVRGALKSSFKRRTLLLGALRAALDDEQFVVRYQPRVLLSSGRTVGMEALVRWDHPELGLLGPDEFIPLMEESGRIRALDEFVLRTALLQAGRWRKMGLGDLRLSVNTSVLELQRLDYPERLAAILTQTDSPPESLELEITEGIMMDVSSPVRRILRTVTAMGVRFAIDDFGTGFSSLSYLRHLPVDVIKIDKSFLREIPADKDSGAIVQAIAALAESLGLELTAEGVERQEQEDFLRQLSCREVQGYLYGRPVTAEEFEQRLRDEAKIGNLEG